MILASELIVQIQQMIDKHGDLPVACTGEHQSIIHASGIDTTHIKDNDEYYLEEVHENDFDEYEEEDLLDLIKIGVIY